MLSEGGVPSVNYTAEESEPLDVNNIISMKCLSCMDNQIKRLMTIVCYKAALCNPTKSFKLFYNS